MSNGSSRKPWWEQRPKTAGEGGFEAERERLRAELARAWRAVAAQPQHGPRRAGSASASRLSVA